MARLSSAVAAFAVILTITVSLGAPAGAHETRRVGPYSLVVGWLSEPAYQGVPNAASVRISDTRVSPAKPVEGLERSLTLEVRSGGLSSGYTRPLRAVFGQPGLYAVDLIPTAAGAYRYLLKGRIEDLEVNETFESGPGRFNDVEAQSGMQYPVQAPAGSELAARLDAIERQLGTIQALAIAALALAIAFGAGGAALARKRA